MTKRIYGIRGAVCAENTPESIEKNVCKMCKVLFEKNNVESDDLVSIHFTMTADLDSMNAATALRKGDAGIDISRASLFVSQEAEIKGMMPFVIRVLVTVYLPESSSPVAVYLNGAEKLRPDFQRDEK